MGVLNVTPDSFSNGGKYESLEKAVERAHQMHKQGADLIDLGGESTRPGTEPVPLEEERRRVIPLLKRLLKELDLPISVDTYKAEIAREALDLGVHLINDISALTDSKLASLIAQYKVPLVIMHMQGTPRNMQENPHYDSLIFEIISFLKERIKKAESAGIDSENIIVDPGIGFGKTVEHNLEIINRLEEFKVLGKPILIGTSRKSFIGKVLGLPLEERLEGTAATVAISILKGASIVRVHDVEEMVRVARMTDAVKSTTINH
jgi:dihydropteroate synthase